MSSYVTLAEARAWLDLDATLDTQLQLALDAAEGLIDSYCGRRFVQVASASRIYDGSGTSALIVDDLLSVTIVQLDEDADGIFEVSVTDYDLAPQNAAADGRPYTWLVRRNGIWRAASAYVRVTGTWGWSAVPPQVKQATLVQASRLLKRRESPFGVASVSLDGAPLRLRSQLDPDVEVLLAPFRRLA